MKIRVRRDRRARISLVEIADSLFGPELAEREQNIRCARQPRTLYGSPETIVDRGVELGIVVTARWAERIVAAIGNADTADAIRKRTRAAAKSNDLRAFARNGYERMLHCATLGALDSAWEGEHGGVVEPPRFADVPPLPSYADKPFREAIEWFRAKKVLSPSAFRALDAGAKRRAFTVARLANQELLGAVHAELARQLEQGADLASFRKFAEQRLESAGWVPANKSHVELVFRNNVVGSYSAGRRREMTQPEVLRARPLFQLRGVGDSRMRANHRKPNGVVVRASDPIFRRVWTPGGHNCRCRFISRAESEAKRLGLEVVDGSVLANFPDPGWETSGPLF